MSRGFIEIKYANHCADCGILMMPGDRVFWDKKRKVIYCMPCTYKVKPPKEEPEGPWPPGSVF